MADVCLACRAGQTMVPGRQAPGPIFNQSSTSLNIFPPPPRSLPIHEPINIRLPATSAPPPFGLRGNAEIQPPATQPPPLRSFVPYTPMFAPATSEPVFGVPLGQPSGSNTRGRRSARRNNQDTHLVQRTRKLSLNVMVIILPHDVSLL